MAASVIALGSNMGDRLGFLRRAARFCHGLQPAGAPAPRSSRIYESAPIGPADAAFLNAALLIETPLSPFGLLRRLKAFERSEGRRPDAPRWSNRPIDLDIITYNNRVLHTPVLHIPHHSYHLRPFVLFPLQDVLPGWQDPETGLSPARLLAAAPRMDLHPTSLHW